jgi:hypothetical protein
MWQSSLFVLVGVYLSPSIHSKSQELICESPRTGSSSRRLHREHDGPITKDNRILVPQGEDGKSEAKNQGHILVPKRRHSFSSHNAHIESRKRARAGGGSPTDRPNSKVGSSPAAPDVNSPAFLPVRTDVLDRLQINKHHYEKRPRHRTRIDKYDSLIRSKSRDVSESEGGKRKCNKRRRKKSGHVLNSDFKAPNAAQDRLTLKANSGPGLFHKGKVSSPMRIRGVPDLSFTEMNFLSKRKDHGESKRLDLKQARSSKSKEKEHDRARQISDYFGRYPAAKSCLDPPPRRDPSGQNSAWKPCEISIASLTNNKDRDKCPQATPNHVSRRQLAPRQDRNRPAPQKHGVADVEQQKEDPSQPLSIPSSHHKQVRMPSSYYSWAVTSSAQGQSLKGHVRGSAENSPQGSRLGSIYLDRQHLDGQHLDGQQHHVTEEHSKKTSHPEPENKPAHESAMSQSSIDHYTRSMLLGSKQDLWNRFPGQDSTVELYNLNDLKCLARLDEFEVTHRQPATLQGELGHPSGLDGERPFNHAVRETESHELHMLVGQNESSKTPHAVLNSGGHTSIRRISLPISSANTTSRSTKADSRHDTWLGPLRLHYPGLSGDIDRDTPVQARLMSTLAPAQPKQYPYFDPRSPDTPLGRTMSSTIFPAALRTHQPDNILMRRTCSQPIRDTAEQIIYDLEQEELLISQHHTQPHSNINNDDVTDLVMEDTSRPSSHPASPLTHHNHPLSYPTTVLPRIRDTNCKHAIPAGNWSDHALCGDDHPTYQPRPSTEMSKPSKHPVEHHSHHHYPRKNVRFTTETRSEAACLGVVGDGVEVAGQEEEAEEDTNKGHDNEQFDLVGFWRPHVLY